jgi:selenide,water dikinase
MIATAVKRGVATEEDRAWALRAMLQRNDVGMQLAEIPGLHSMTDVTGYGLAGHLLEVASASGLRAELDLESIPTYRPPRLRELYQQFCMPNLTTTNYRSVQADASAMDGYTMAVLCDPQTSGGLLVACAPESVDEALAVFHQYGFADACEVGEITPASADGIKLKVR